MRSSVPGLYVAGGLGGHSNGLIALATYDGRVVADGVAADLPALDLETPDEEEIAAEARRLDRLRTPAPAGMAPAKAKERLRALMWEKVGIEKTATEMEEALDEIRRLRLDLSPGMRISYAGKIANYEWLDAIDVVNMLDACELVTLSSLERKESRGPFFRKDHPLTDNESWLAANVLKKSGNGVRFERRRYELPMFRPDFVRKDNFDVTW
jgi:succinate dehydrogenase/fumarate reductase flavoprotein subunit